MSQTRIDVLLFEEFVTFATGHHFAPARIESIPGIHQSFACVPETQELAVDHSPLSQATLVAMAVVAAAVVGTPLSLV